MMPIANKAQKQRYIYDIRLTKLMCLSTIDGLFLEGFPSGQRDQTVNLTAQPSEVRILPPPFYCGKIYAGVVQW